MKKAEIDILHASETIDVTHPILQQHPKTHQQQFLLTYLGLRLLKNSQEMPLLPSLITPLNGSFSQLLLLIEYMRKCMDKGQLLDNSNFHILSTLILWMGQQEKHSRNPKASLVFSILLPHPTQLSLQQFQELIVYLNYIALDLIKIIKAGETQTDDLLQLLDIILPRVYFNIILNLDSLGEESDRTEDVLFFNQSLQYYTRTNNNYRSLCKVILRHVINQPLKQNQMRQMLERSCRYYQLFWKDHKTSTELFLTAFQKATEAARFALTDEFVLFFKVIGKLGDNHLEKQIRSKYEWVDNLLDKFGTASVVGHPKGEVNPFNVLGIKQAIKVDAGKSRHRIIQIYNEFSLFYFKIDIQAHDISVRLYYLGDFQSKVEVKKLLLTQQKISVELRSAFVAAKKGIYMIEFDNSYSWVNSKNLKFEYILLAQHKQYKYPLWMNILFDLKTQENQNNKRQIKTSRMTQSVEKPIDIAEYSETQQNSNEKPAKHQQQGQLEQEQQLSQEQYEQQQQEFAKDLKKNEQENNTAELQHSNSQDKPYKDQNISKSPENTANRYNEHQTAQQRVKTPETKETSLEEKSERPIYIQSKAEQEKTQKIQIISSNSLPSQQGSEKVDWGQGNLSLIDGIFSLLVNVQDHTYQFQTNLQDRILKRLRSYCQGKDKLQWIFNSEARDWLKKHGFCIYNRNSVTLLRTNQQSSIK